MIMSQCVCLCREDEAWLDIKLHCTGTLAQNDSAKALNDIPKLPGAAANKPAAAAAAANPDAVSLMDLSYDDKSGFRGRSSASAFFVQPG